MASLTSSVPGVDEFIDAIENGVTSAERGRRPERSLISVITSSSCSVGVLGLVTTSTSGRGVLVDIVCSTACLRWLVEVMEVVRDASLLVGADRDELLTGITCGGFLGSMSCSLDSIGDSSEPDIVRI